MDFENHKRAGTQEKPVQGTLPGKWPKETRRSVAAPEPESPPEAHVCEGDSPRVNPDQLLLW